MAIDGIREVVRDTYMSGQRDPAIARAIGALHRQIDRLFDPGERIGVLRGALTALKEAVKLQCIAVMRSQRGKEMHGVFAEAYDRNGTPCPAVEAYLVSLLQEILMIRGSVSGKSSKNLYRAMGKIAAYHGPAFAAGFFEGERAIKEALEEGGVSMTETEVREVFTQSVRMHFAVNNIGDPLEAVGRVGTHLRVTLTDQAIRETLETGGVSMTEEEVWEVFTKSVRMHFAVHNIGDPLAGILAWVRGEVTYGGKPFAVRGSRGNRASP